MKEEKRSPPAPPHLAIDRIDIDRNESNRYRNESNRYRYRSNRYAISIKSIIDIDQIDIDLIDNRSNRYQIDIDRIGNRSNQYRSNRYRIDIDIDIDRIDIDIDRIGIDRIDIDRSLACTSKSSRSNVSGACAATAPPSAPDDDASPPLRR